MPYLPWSGSWRRRVRLSATLLGLLLGLGLLGWLGLRNRLLDYAWDRAQRRAQNLGYTLTAKDLRFQGLVTLRVQGLVVSYQGQAVVAVKAMMARPALLRLGIGDLRLQTLHLRNLRLQALQTRTVCNVCPLLTQTPHPSAPEGKSKTPINQRIYDFATQILDRLPPDFQIKDSYLLYRNDTLETSLGLPFLTYRNNQINGQLQIRENQDRGAVGIQGVLDRSSMTGTLRLTPKGQRTFRVPWVHRKLGLTLGLGPSVLTIKQFVMRDGVLNWDASGRAIGIQIQHSRLSAEAVQLPLLSGRFRGRAGADFVEVDSSTVFRMNRLPLRVYALADRGPNARWDLRLTTAWSPSTDFLASLPQGIFESTRGMKARGKLRFRFSLQLEDKAPQNCRLRSALDQKGFQITRMGRTDLRRMNGPFQHTVVRNGQPQRTISVGPSNPFYTPLDRIPLTMQQAVMTGEDGDFYHHKGFYPDAFRRSLAQNYRQGKFARGGSTITMQLVKNVFLHPRKTIARKSEEFLLTWLIENQRLTSKARMMEVYLNVIEFGENVWGVGEAARFYFDKTPAELDPIQCVFLAGLVPRPRVLQHLLESDGKVSPRNGFYTAIRDRFYRRGWLPLEDSARRDVGLRPSVYRHLAVPDSTLLLTPLEWDDEDQE